MSRRETVALGALVAALLIAVSLRWWLAVDEAVYEWIQFHRSCAVERASLWVDPIVRGTLGMLILIWLGCGGFREPMRLVGMVAVFAVGAGTVEILKTAIERLRPNSVPMMSSGNSFPSGHTTGTAMGAAIAIVLIHQLRLPRAIKGSMIAIAAGTILLQAVGRLVNGSHWLSDCISSALFGCGWVLAATWMRRLPRPVSVSVVALGTVVGMAFASHPDWRLHLPSALDEARPVVASVEFGDAETHADLGGRWNDGPTEPIGPVSWALSPDVSVRLRGSEGERGILKITLRPATGAGNRRRCARVVVTVNGWSAPEIALARGWREYHLEPPPGVLKADDNTIHFHIIGEAPGAGDGPAGALAAFRYVRLYPRA